MFTGEMRATLQTLKIGRLLTHTTNWAFAMLLRFCATRETLSRASREQRFWWSLLWNSTYICCNLFLLNLMKRPCWRHSWWTVCQPVHEMMSSPLQLLSNFHWFQPWFAHRWQVVVSLAEFQKNAVADEEFSHNVACLTFAHYLFLANELYWCFGCASFSWIFIIFKVLLQTRC